MSTGKLHIRSLELENFRCFENLSLTLHPRLNVFFGENGAGKSAILASLNMFLEFFITKAVGLGEQYTNLISEKDISIGMDKAKVTVYAEKNGVTGWRTEIKRQRDGKKATPKFKGRLLTACANISQEFNTLPVIVSYFASRNLKHASFQEEIDYTHNNVAHYQDAIGYRTSFDEFFSWFKYKEDVENESLRRQFESKTEKCAGNIFVALDAQLETVRRALKVFFPQFTKFTVKRKIESFIAIKDGKEFDIEQLSDGEKIYILLIGDIARRLAIANPLLNNPLEGEGIVLIDEIELHLHPKWQRMIIPQLLKTFPNCQFIVTSHSPQVLGEVSVESVWILKEGEAPRHPKYSYGLTSAEILDGEMGAASRNIDVTKELEDIDRLIDNEQFDEARASIKALAKITGHIPAIVGSNSYLTMMGQEQAEIEEE